MNFWDNWAKPWTRDQCRDRYVQGSPITYPQLAEASGVPLGTINRWRKGDAGKTWKQQREEFTTATRSETDRKAIAARSESEAMLRAQNETAMVELVQELKVSLKELGREHFESYQSIRRVAHFTLGQYERIVRELVDPDAINEATHPEIAAEIRKKRLEFQVDPGKFIKAINLHSLSAIASIIDLCVRGERMATGMHYEDLNEAVRRIKKAGLEVSVPEDTDLVKVTKNTTVETH